MREREGGEREREVCAAAAAVKGEVGVGEKLRG